MEEASPKEDVLYVKEHNEEDSSNTEKNCPKDNSRDPAVEGSTIFGRSPKEGPSAEESPSVEESPIAEESPSAKERPPPDESPSPSSEERSPPKEVTVDSKPVILDVNAINDVLRHDNQLEIEIASRNCLALIENRTWPAPRPKYHTGADSRACVTRRASYKLISVLFYIFWSFVVFSYMSVGACLFHSLEIGRETSQSAHFERLKNDTAILLATELRQVAAHEPIWAQYVFKHLSIFEENLLKANGVVIREEKRWSLRSSFYYCISLVTTTGYGSMTPKSEWGRTATVCFSALGVPLLLNWFIFTGYCMSYLWSGLLNSCCLFNCTKTRGKGENNMCRSNSVVPLRECPSMSGRDSKGATFRAKKRQNTQKVKDCEIIPKHSIRPPNSTRRIEENRESRQPDLDHTVHIVFSVLFFVGYFIIGSAVLAEVDDWAITDTLYLNFLMFLTLGPGCFEWKETAAEMRIRENVCYTIFLIFGYCWIAMILNLIYAFYVPSSRSYWTKQERG